MLSDRLVLYARLILAGLQPAVAVVDVASSSLIGIGVCLHIDILYSGLFFLFSWRFS